MVSGDGETMGEIEKIIVKAPGNRATHIVVSQGLLSKEHKLISTMWISNVIEDEVRLAINSEALERLPEHDPVA